MTMLVAKVQFVNAPTPWTYIPPPKLLAPFGPFTPLPEEESVPPAALLPLCAALALKVQLMAVRLCAL